MRTYERSKTYVKTSLIYEVKITKKIAYLAKRLQTKLLAIQGSTVLCFRGVKSFHFLHVFKTSTFLIPKFLYCFVECHIVLLLIARLDYVSIPAGVMAKGNLHKWSNVFRDLEGFFTEMAHSI